MSGKRPTRKCLRCHRTVFLKKRYSGGSEPDDWQHVGRNTSGVQCFTSVPFERGGQER